MQPASRKSRGPRLKETKREKKRRRKVRRKQKVSIHFSFFHFHLPALMSFLFVPYVSCVNPVQYTGFVSRHSIGWICSYFYYFSFRSKGRGEGARGGENGHLKVRKRCTHSPCCKGSGSERSVNFPPHCGSFRPKEESKTP